jgi:hypothetical protein
VYFLHKLKVPALGGHSFKTLTLVTMESRSQTFNVFWRPANLANWRTFQFPVPNIVLGCLFARAKILYGWP